MSKNKNNEKISIEELVDREVIDKIETMERDNYVFPKRFSKRDYIFLAVFVIICLALVIMGAWL